MSYSLPKYQLKQSCPATLHNSTQVSFEQPARKYSMMQLNNRIDIDQVMVDIKLTPLKNNQYQQKIKTIYSCLQYLKNYHPTLLEQVRTAQLVIQSIQNKLKKQQLDTKKHSQLNHQAKSKPIHPNQLFNKSSHKKQQSQLLSKRKPSLNILNNIYSDVSPIKQLDQATSRIVYTNFSIKDLQNSCHKQYTQKKITEKQSIDKQSIVKQSIDRQSMDSKLSQKKFLINQSRSTKEIRPQSSSKNKMMHRKQGSVFTVSVFESEDQQMQRLTRNIQALDKVLQQKGLGFKNNLTRDKNGKTALKQVTLNTTKQNVFKSQKKPLIFNSKHKSISNKQNL